MKQTSAQQKVEFMAEAGALFAELMEWEAQTEKPNLTQLEDLVLALRKRIGECMAEKVIMRQEVRQPGESAKPRM